jgi:hypothetical protein
MESARLEGKPSLKWEGIHLMNIIVRRFGTRSDMVSLEATSKNIAAKA